MVSGTNFFFTGAQDKVTHWSSVVSLLLRLFVIIG